MTPERWSPAARAYAAAQQAWQAPKSHMRVGDADRQRVVAELQRHYVEGRLTSEELAERVDRALTARTEGDLALLLEDLPPPEETQPVVREQQWWTRFVTFPGVVLLAMLGVMLLTWLIWLPGGHLGPGGPPVWSVFFLGFFFFGRPPRSRRH
jgi:hypothetical protein